MEIDERRKRQSRYGYFFLPILICNKVGLQVYTVYGMFYEILFYPLLLPDWRDPFSLNSVDKVQKDWLEVKYMTLSYIESFFWLDIAYFFSTFSHTVPYVWSKNTNTFNRKSSTFQIHQKIYLRSWILIPWPLIKSLSCKMCKRLTDFDIDHKDLKEIKSKL